MDFVKRFLRQKYLTWRLNRLKANKVPQDFSQVLKKVRHILVIIPPNMTMETIMPRFIPRLYEVFGENIRISTFEKSTFRKEDSTWLGLPKDEYLDIFRTEQIDLIIDLNEWEDMFCTYVCALIPAPLKVNLAEGGAFDHIYNLHIRTARSKSLDGKLDTLAGYFKTLMG